MSSMLNLTRGKHRGHLPDPVEADKQALQAGRDIVLGMMGVTPEMTETRKAFARTPGWARKCVADIVERTMTARYTGKIQIDDRVQAKDSWSGRVVEGTVNSISISEGVETVFGIVTGDGTQYEAPLSEVTKL
jgi:hypothetical protein